MSAERHLPVEDFAAVLALVADIVAAPSFPDAEVDHAARGSRSRRSGRKRTIPPPMAVDAFVRALYGSIPIRGRSAGRSRRSSRSSAQDLVRFYQKGFMPSGLIVVVVGDVERGAGRADDVAALRRLDAAASWARSRCPTPEQPAARRPRRVPMMNKAQADVAYGFVGIRRYDPDYTAISVMNNALGQYAIGGRLGDSIRERQGMAYYVFSSLDAGFGQGR